VDRCAIFFMRRQKATTMPSPADEKCVQFRAKAVRCLDHYLTGGVTPAHFRKPFIRISKGGCNGYLIWNTNITRLSNGRSGFGRRLTQCGSGCRACEGEPL
jgi:hypothetical protein